MKRVFFIIVFLISFYLFFSPTPAYACPSGSFSNSTSNCQTLSCGGQNQPGWWTGETTYRYSTQDTCSQTEYFSDGTCDTLATDPFPDACNSGCSSDSECVPGAACVGGLEYNYCTTARDTQPSQNGGWCVAWNCGATCTNNASGCQPVPPCNSSPCQTNVPYSDVQSCNNAKQNGFCGCNATSCPSGYQCVNGGCTIPGSTSTPTPTRTPTPTPTITPTPTSPPPGQISGYAGCTTGLAYSGGGTVCLDPNGSAPYCNGRPSTSLSGNGSFIFTTPPGGNHNVFLDPNSLQSGNSVSGTNPWLTTYNTSTSAFSPSYLSFGINCPGPSTTPILTPTPTSGASCTGDYMTCFRPGNPPYPSNCRTTGISSAQHDSCQPLTGGGSLCAYCPPPAATPPPSCTYQGPPTTAPTVTLLPDGHTVKITYDVDGSVSPDLSFHRNNKPGFLSFGSGTLIGTQFGSVDIYFKKDVLPRTVYYLQAENDNGTQKSQSNVSSVLTRDAPNTRSCNSEGSTNVALQSAQFISATATTMTFELRMNVNGPRKANVCSLGCSSSECGINFHPKYIQVTGDNGVSGVVPWVDPTHTSCLTSTRSCGKSWCTLSGYKARYTVALPPSTSGNYTVGGYVGLSCSNQESIGNVNFSGATIAGTAGTLNPPFLTSLNDASNLTNTRYLYLTWSPVGNGIKTSVYHVADAWPDTGNGLGRAAITQNTPDNRTYTDYDDLTNLPLGTYYYGADLYSSSWCSVTPTSHLKSTQTPFVWAGYTISGNVFLDDGAGGGIVANGIKDGGEQAYINGQTSIVLSGGPSTPAPAIPDSSGNYTMRNLLGGRYTVTITLPSGLIATTTNPVINIDLPPSKVVNFGIVPAYSISGVVFVDTNQNGVRDGAEPSVAGQTIKIYNNGGVLISTFTTLSNADGNTGTYTTGRTLPPGTYRVSYESLPTRYRMTHPVNTIPPSFTVRIGPGCMGGYCDTLNNISFLNFGISQSSRWFQGIGGDMRIDAGFTDIIPAAADPKYAGLAGQGGTAGLIFSGDTLPDFGQNGGSASPQGWVVSGTGETFKPASNAGIRTSYSYILGNVNRNKTTITPKDLPCGNNSLGSCSLAGITNGVYLADGDVVLTGDTDAGCPNAECYKFPTGKNIIILVHGNLTIKENLLVPNGSTVMFSVSGNITIDKSLGRINPTVACVPSTVQNGISTGCVLEGFYSADGSIAINGNNGDCTTPSGSPPIGGMYPDKQLTIAGALITNAKREGGSLQNLRDLCNFSATVPTFVVTERPDLILNTPEILKVPNYIWQEVAP